MPRPIAYDRNAVVKLSLEQFWTEGFGKSDIDRLTRTVGVNRHSLYSAFGGKTGLYKEALVHYIETVASEFLDILECGSGLEGILAYFEKASDVYSAMDNGLDPNRGCFITNTLIEFGQSDGELCSVIDDYYSLAEKAFLKALRRGQKDNSIRSDLNPRSTARILVLTSQGASVSSRLGRTKPNLLQPVRTLLCIQ
jgi:TetR/AcrR family transcriptional repressor of nem operon